MTQKTISLNEKAYKKLKKLKRKGETYSDLILRLCNSQEISERDDILLKLIGAFKDNDEYWEKIEKQIQENRSTHLTSEED